ncbi:hypothetical protein PAXINDRAFT_17768 [Paxillus involutus ATCC 200175]|uniref:Uncharacterized protein n=1 Tax=Paxillus involutus ATCC 200175 TaxID=664439 RepID=A0A0C9TDV9_PAXIN|nr:hypothetical protein PAXINDRAFT_17768 [Paxillus involutus ATCC 200175]
MPQHLETTRQTAYNEAADTSNPNMMSAGPTEPAGMSNEPRNESNKGEKGGEKDEKGVWASGIEDPSSNDDSGDEEVCHAYIIPNTTLPPPYHALPTPDERRQPPNMLLEGEKNGDEEGQETRKGTREVEETTNIDEDGQYMSNEAEDLPPEPPPPTPHLPTPEPPQLDTAGLVTLQRA